MIIETKKYAKKNSRVREFFLLLIIWGAMASLFACAHVTLALPLTSITIQLSGTYSTQLIGFYATNKSGDYTVGGLLATFIERCPNVDRQTLLLNGTAQFAPDSGSQLIPTQTNGKALRPGAILLGCGHFAFLPLTDPDPAHFKGFVEKTFWLPLPDLPILPMLIIEYNSHTLPRIGDL